MVRRRKSVAPPRRGPSLMGTAARTAVISGTATATSRAVDSSIHGNAMQAQAELEQMKAQQFAAMQASSAQPIAPAAQPDLLAQLKQLAELKEAGALSEEEFQLAKAKLLN